MEVGQEQAPFVKAIMFNEFKKIYIRFLSFSFSKIKFVWQGKFIKNLSTSGMKIKVSLKSKKSTWFS